MPLRQNGDAREAITASAAALAGALRRNRTLRALELGFEEFGSTRGERQRHEAVINALTGSSSAGAAEGTTSSVVAPGRDGGCCALESLSWNLCPSAGDVAALLRGLPRLERLALCAERLYALPAPGVSEAIRDALLGRAQGAAASRLAHLDLRQCKIKCKGEKQPVTPW